MVENTLTTEASMAGAGAASAACDPANAAQGTAVSNSHASGLKLLKRIERAMKSLFISFYCPSTVKTSSALPEFTYTVPFTMVAPPWSSGPPRAMMPFNVSKFLPASKTHCTLPSMVE